MITIYFEKKLYFQRLFYYHHWYDVYKKAKIWLCHLLQIIENSNKTENRFIKKYGKLCIIKSGIILMRMPILKNWWQKCDPSPEILEWKSSFTSAVIFVSENFYFITHEKNYVNISTFVFFCDVQCLLQFVNSSPVLMRVHFI